MENKFLDSGALFLNDRKQNEKAPDWKGDVEFSTPQDEGRETLCIHQSIRSLHPEGTRYRLCS